MMRSIRSDQNPNLFVLQYLDTWEVCNLILIPRFFFGESAIRARRPLSASAKRAHWVGCEIMLDAIPIDGKIRVVTNGVVTEPESVRLSYSRLSDLSAKAPNVRGWTLDVLSQVRKLGTREFQLSDIYKCEGILQCLHPSNRHIRPKIRQQLQVLRDLGILEFLSRGRYRIRD